MKKTIYFFYRIYKATLESLLYTKKVFRVTFRSKETSTFTYELTEENELYLIEAVSTITKFSFAEIKIYFDELKNNHELKEYIVSNISKSSYRFKKDLRCNYGSRIAWYALIRSLKPAIIVENGVEMGITAIVFCSAIYKNIEEGYKGKYIGLDIDSNAGFLIKKSGFLHFAEVIIGDAIETLKSLKIPIDLYFSDGLRSYEYEKKEFEHLKKWLSPQTIVITNKALFSPALLEFAHSEKKHFLYFKEEPSNHWYNGAGFGLMY